MDLQFHMSRVVELGHEITVSGVVPIGTGHQLIYPPIRRYGTRLIFALPHPDDIDQWVVIIVIHHLNEAVTDGGGESAFSWQLN